MWTHISHPTICPLKTCSHIALMGPQQWWAKTRGLTVTWRKKPQGAWFSTACYIGKHWQVKNFQRTLVTPCELLLNLQTLSKLAYLTRDILPSCARMKIKHRWLSHGQVLVRFMELQEKFKELRAELQADSVSKNIFRRMDTKSFGLSKDKVLYFWPRRWWGAGCTPHAVVFSCSADRCTAHLVFW